MSLQRLLPGVSAPTPSPLEHLERRRWPWKGERKGLFLEQLLWSVLGELEGGLALREAGPTAKAPDGVEGDTTSTDKVRNGSFLARQNDFSFMVLFVSTSPREAFPAVP